MHQNQTFELDGVRFVIDVRPGKDRGKSTTNQFILVKTHAFLDFYRDLQRREPRTILELGIFEGGSLVLFDKLYRPSRLVGLDVRNEIGPLEEYRRDKEYIRVLYRQPQDDPQLPAILRREFPNGIDLIVDDASHHYTQTRASLQLCFPLLKPGGLYVIEDWSWSHKAPYQQATEPWYDKPALTNLVFELVVNMPGSRQMESVTVHRDLLVIEKAGNASGPLDLAAGHANLRGRWLVRI